MQSFRVLCPSKDIKGEITLSGSKSISNRVLLIQALCEESFDIYNLSDSDDSISMQQLLNSNEDLLDAHHAGTTFRFLTAYLSTREGSQILTGSERMKQRPVKALVDALNIIGANIEYLENEGYPPLKINSPTPSHKSEISLPANISSQYISALLMIGPTLPDGLIMNLEGDIVSRPYIEMTINIMSYFGVSTIWEGQKLIIRPQKYIPKSYHVEADWSAASYFYTIAGLSHSAEITLKGLHKNSLQGDANIVKICAELGLDSIFGDYQITILKKDNSSFPEFFEYNFIKVPDIAQSISVLCAGKGCSILYSGLQTLKIKETDRISALKKEHEKMGVFLNKMPSKFSQKSGTEYYLQEGKSLAEHGTPFIDTYHDHRMAMSFAPLGLIFPVQINDPDVVSKSYPGFWRDLISLGFIIEETNIQE